MTDAPRERAELMAFCVVVSQAPLPPSEMLSTLAGLAFAGTPETVPPDSPDDGVGDVGGVAAALAEHARRDDLAR